ncbi:MAG: hypothetical protein CMQ41_06820 [Gammaproteobacteria bacterium]|nr:hypothetical protein [Gammaproteobacteria bacterium]
MIRLFIFSLFVILFVLIVSLYVGFPIDPGYLLVVFGNYTFETSLFALFVVSVVLYLFIKLIGIFLQWINPKKIIDFGQDFNERRRMRARNESTEGLLYFARGNWQSSYKLLTKNKADKDASVIDYLAASYAAQKLNIKGNWLDILEKAEEKYPKANFTINFLKAKLLFRSGHLEQSVAVLEQLKKTSASDPSLLWLLKEVYIALKDWKALNKLIPTLVKNKLMATEELDELQKRIFIEQLDVYGGGKGEISKQDALVQIKKLWESAPPKYYEDEEVVKYFSGLLIELGAKADAAKAIEVAVSRQWSKALILRYGELDFGISPQQLILAEAWLKARPADANLMLCLGRISMRNDLWGKAKEYFEASIKLSPTANAYGELSRLLRCLGEADASEIYQQKFVDLIEAQLPELPMPRENKVAHKVCV